MIPHDYGLIDDGLVYIAGNWGLDCPAANELDENGRPSIWRCDECDYLMCCVEETPPEKCFNCMDDHCPWAVGYARRKRMEEEAQK